ncbi:peptidyl-tRNA hydrolase [Terfezia boudieri ATCC MYA-4762]|uniref:Peptidyl-tRNA hydrolase n=1 Tax=Terfezia boudieri ATCC MYA-4762 TaxID=1051890 RepID=A0A3N4LPG6_9PEZI|nr:peptidyl-tRNA hydrolase [Terfezia boudieri ATCC MYA-4762]
MSGTPVRRLLICSLGNPGPTYLNTRHSAGHFILTRLSSHLHSRPLPLVEDRSYRGPVALDHTYTLFHTPTLMNISGPAVSHAWKTFSASLDPQEKQQALLVLLHDELEKEVCEVKLKMGGNSGGQKGLGSVINSMGGKGFARIGIGIGRPESKESEVVAEYVLGKLTRIEKELLEEVSLEKVARLVRMLAEEKSVPKTGQTL